MRQARRLHLDGFPVGERDPAVHRVLRGVAGGGRQGTGAVTRATTLDNALTCGNVVFRDDSPGIVYTD